MKKGMEYKGYKAAIEYDSEDNILVGRVLGIADTLVFHGESVDELNKMFKQSIDNYLDLCKRVGKEPEKAYKGSFNVRISPDLHRKIAIEAAEEKMTLNQYVIKALERSIAML